MFDRAGRDPGSASHDDGRGSTASRCRREGRNQEAASKSVSERCRVRALSLSTSELRIRGRPFGVFVCRFFGCMEEGKMERVPHPYVGVWQYAIHWSIIVVEQRPHEFLAVVPQRRAQICRACRKLHESGPTSAEAGLNPVEGDSRRCREKLARSGPRLVRRGSKFASDPANMGRLWPNRPTSARNRPLRDKVGPDLVEVGGRCTEMARKGATGSAKCPSLFAQESRSFGQAARPVESNPTICRALVRDTCHASRTYVVKHILCNLQGRIEASRCVSQ